MSQRDPLDQLPEDVRAAIERAVAETSGMLKLHLLNGEIVAVTLHEGDDESGRMLWASPALGDAE